MRRNRVVITFALLTALLAAGYGVMFTVLDDYRLHYGLDGGVLGLIVAAGFFSSFVAQVALAPLADRGHARQMAILGLLLNVVGLAGMAFGTNAVLLLASRVVMGTGAGIAVPAARRIVILSDPAHLGRNIGRLMSADVGGFAAGPAISAVLTAPFGLAAPFLAVGVLTIACLPFILGTRVDETVEVPDERFAFDLLRSPAFVGALCMGAALFVMIGTFDSLWVLVLNDLRAADWIANIGITVFALPLVVLGPMGGRFTQRLGPFRVGTVGLVFGALFMALYGKLPTGVAMLTVAMVHACFDSLTVSSSSVTVGLVVAPARQAGGQGMLGGVQTLVGGLAAVEAGWVYEHQGRAVAFVASAATMVALALAALALAGPYRSRPVRASSGEVAAALS